MKKIKKSYKVLSLLLALCMLMSVLPVVSQVAASDITYLRKWMGVEELSVSAPTEEYSDRVITTKSGGYGKSDSDTVYVYNPTSSHSGKNYFYLPASTPSSSLSGSVIEFEFLLEDSSAYVSFMGSFFNQAGYDAYIESDNLVTTDTYRTTLDNLIKFSSEGVKVTYNGSSSVVSDPLEVGVWHTAALKTPGINENDEGESDFLLYLDGKEYTIVTEAFYGSVILRLYGAGNKLLDNIMVYRTEELSDASVDYKNYSLVPTLSGGNDSFSLDSKTITLYDSVTVGGLKNSLSGADAIRVYSDSTFETELEDADYISAGNKVVAATKNGDDIERCYSYYSVELPSYTEDDLYDGTDDLAGSCSIVGIRTGCSVTKDISGVFGKAADDKVYKLDVTGTCHTGYNYLCTFGSSTFETMAFEFSLAVPENINFRFATSFYTDDAGTSAMYDFLEITDGIIKTRPMYSDGGAILDEKYRGMELGTLTPREWVNIAVVVPGYATEGKTVDTIYVYINGVKHELALSSEVYGANYNRFAVYEPSLGTGTRTVYYDNIRKYFSPDETYDIKKDAQPVVNFGALSVENGNITIDENTMIADLKKKISTTATLRVFEDNTFATELEDSDYIGENSIAVFATNNLRTTERSYSYYTFSETTYEEPGLYNGSNDLKVYAGTSNPNPAIVTKVGGVFGKAEDDPAYKFDITTGSLGMNFLGNTGKTLDTRTMEISFALTNNSPSLSLSGTFYKSAVTEDNVTIDGQSVSNTTTGTILTISSNTISTGDHSALVNKRQKICDLPNEQWISLAVVVGGYNQQNEGASELLVYVNGMEYKVPLAKPSFGSKLLRFSPTNSYDETKTVYYDNFRYYDASTESYDAAKDRQPVVDLSAFDVINGNITLDEGTTVADFKATVDTRVAVRVYKSDLYDTLLSDSDKMSGGNIVVFAAKNSRTTERAFAYYSVNRPFVADSIKLTNADGKVIRGSQKDIVNIGETYYIETTIKNKSEQTVALKAIAVSYDTSGKMVDYVEKPVSVTPGTTIINADENAIAFEDVTTPEGGTLKAFLWVEENNEPLCEAFNVEFNGKEEYHILAYSNSYGMDACTYLPAVGKAGGVDIYAVVMFTGGCSFKEHYSYMNGKGTYTQRAEYTPEGVFRAYDISFLDGLNTPNYTWDYITLQSRSVEAYDFDNYYTESTPYLTELADYIKQNAPGSELLMHETWTLDTDTAKTSVYTADMVAGLTDEEIRPLLFNKLKANYIRAAEMIDNPNRIIPVGEAVNYALSSLGFAEWVKDESGNYISSARGMYRDTTCHLSDPYGRVLASLVWYEYLTGYDARENLYQNAGIPEADMVLLKDAAHWACTQAVYN